LTRCCRGTSDRDASYRDWCKKDGVAKLQSTFESYPPVSSYHASTSAQPLHRSHQRPRAKTPQLAPAPYSMHTDHMATYYPPAGTLTRTRDPRKFDALGRTSGWAPHTSNKPGNQRAVYDPVSHKSTLYTFDNTGGVSWSEGNGDKLMRDKAQSDAEKGHLWHGRRKGVVEFVDRTHPSATNANKEFLDWCAVKEHAYHTPTGELTKWMDNAFSSKMKVPFYGKHPYEMNK